MNRPRRGSDEMYSKRFGWWWWTGPAGRGAGRGRGTTVATGDRKVYMYMMMVVVESKSIIRWIARLAGGGGRYGGGDR